MSRNGNPTRKTFLGTVAAAFTATALGSSRVVLTRRHDEITQAELRAILDAERSTRETLWKMRRRLEAGAAVEPGELAIEMEDPTGRLSPWDQPTYTDSYGLTDCGLEIGHLRNLEPIIGRLYGGPQRTVLA